jgi:hypothetical protein
MQIARYTRLKNPLKMWQISDIWERYLKIQNCMHYEIKVGRDSSVGIATRYELDGQVIESLWE